MFVHGVVSDIMDPMDPVHEMVFDGILCTTYVVVILNLTSLLLVLSFCSLSRFMFALVDGCRCHRPSELGIDVRMVLVALPF